MICANYKYLKTYIGLIIDNRQKVTRVVGSWLLSAAALPETSHTTLLTIFTSCTKLQMWLY